MTSWDLTEDQLNRLYGLVSRCLADQHAMILELQATHVARDGRLYGAARGSVLAMRELYLEVNDGRRKGVSHRAQKRARSWPPV